MMPKWRFRFLRISFGLTPEYIENVYEQFFFLQYSGGWSLTEAYNLPIGLRAWFVKRLVKQLQDEKEAMEKAQKGTSNSQTLGQHNAPKRM
tara:strand:+ start:180 stop:452 length:273 start_codon:yes stop_codon:yes gene_type:complete